MYPHLGDIVFPEPSRTPHNLRVLNSLLPIAMSSLMEDTIHAGVSLEPTKSANVMTLLLPIKADILSWCMGLNGPIRGANRFCFTIPRDDFPSSRNMR